MTEITIVRRDGEASALTVASGLTLMEAIRDSGFDELLSLCGGCCSCATCHVHIDDAAMAKLPPMSADEGDLLDSSEHRNASSRLSCQIQITPEVAGMVVTIAAED